MLVAGALVIGRREKGKDIGKKAEGHARGSGIEGSRLVVGGEGEEEPDAPLPGLGEEEAYKDDMELSPRDEVKIPPEEDKKDLL